MRPSDDLAPPLRPLEDSYELIRELGGTNATVVYLARVRASDRLVALKALRAQFLRDSDAVARFRREARTMAALVHPNIVKTIAVEQIGQRTAAIVMEYLEGGTLREVIRSHGAMSFDQARSILADVAAALRYAHGLGIVHRDVKPENIFIAAETGRAMLSDFGIARDMMLDTRLTLAGSAVGTPTYMAPEQIDGQSVDERADIYSLGVLGWELVTGLRPWDGETLYGVIYKQKNDALPSLRTLRADTPLSLRDAIEVAMRKDASERWGSMAEFLDRLGDSSADAPAEEAPNADLPTLNFRRADETLRGVVIPPPPAERTTQPVDRITKPVDRPIEREVRLQSAKDAVLPPVVREPEVPEVVKEPEVRRPRVTVPRRRVDPQVVEASVAGVTVPIAETVPEETIAREDAVAELIARLDETNQEPETPQLVGDERRSQPRTGAATMAAEVPHRVAPPGKRNPMLIAIPSVIALAAAAVILFARRDREGPARTDTDLRDTVVTVTSGGAVTPDRRPSTPPRVREASPSRQRTSQSPSRTPTPTPRVSQRVVASNTRPATAPAPRSRMAPPPVIRESAPPEETAPLIDRIADNDVELNRIYQQLIGVLRRGSAEGEEPEAVQALRAQQRMWLLRRDAACRAGTIDERATCFRDQSRNRATELRTRLDSSPSSASAGDTPRPVSSVERAARPPLR